MKKYTFAKAEIKGYTEIPDDILEALARTNLPGECHQVLHYILRKTYGWNKTKERISLKQFVEGTRKLKNNVSRAIRKLIDRNIIIKTGSADAFFTKKGVEEQPFYEVQTNFKNWIGYIE